jgi:hypothetical protein
VVAVAVRSLLDLEAELHLNRHRNGSLLIHRSVVM